MASEARLSGRGGSWLGDLFQADPGRPLLHLSRRVDVDGAPAAGVLAETAARAPLLDQRRRAEEVAHLAFGVAQKERVERADLDAQLASAADAVVLDDVRLRPLLARERPADVAELIEDRLRRANDAAGAAVDAELRIDDVEDVAFAR